MKRAGLAVVPVLLFLLLFPGHWGTGGGSADRTASIAVERRCRVGAGGEAWYVISVRDRRIGFLGENVYEREGPEGALLVFESVAVCKVRYDESEYTSTLFKECLVDGRTLTVRSFRVERKGGGGATVYEGSIDNGRLTVRVETSTVRKEEVFSVERFVPEQLARVMMVDEGIDVDRFMEFTDFDSELGAPVRKRLSIRRAVEGAGGPSVAFPWRMTLSEGLDGGDEQVFLLDRDLRTGRVELSTGAVLLRTTRSEAMAAGAVSPSIGELGAIQTAQEIRNPERVRSLAVRIGLPGWQGLPLHWEGRVEPIAGCADALVLTCGGRTADGAVSGAAGVALDGKACGDEETSLYVESGDPLIIQTAREIVSGVADKGEQCRRLLEWTGSHVGGANGGIQALASAKTALRTGHGDCTEKAFLFAALAHSLGIQTRLCMGVVYRSGRFRYHAWNAVWVGGTWVAVDSGFGQFGTDATHIQLWVGGYSQRDIHSMMSLLKSVHGRMQIEVLSYSDDGKQ